MAYKPTRKPSNLAEFFGSFDTASANDIAEAVGVSSRTVRRWRQMLDEQNAKPIADGVLEAPDERRGVLDGKRFVFTCAQNNTHVHDGFLRSLMQFCNHRNAELIVAPVTYNIQGFQNLEKSREGLWFDPAIKQYLLPKSMQVGPGGKLDGDDLVWCGDLDVLPTAVRPLSGLWNYTRHASGIVPHTKLAMESVPVLPGQARKFMYTTGAVTQRNYIQRKAGQKAEFHHVYGALYVEFDDEGDWFARQLNADKDGMFFDLDEHFSPDAVHTGESVAGIVFGDVHCPRVDIDALAGAYSMAEVLKPEAVVLHDLIDWNARSWFNRSNAVHRLRTYMTHVTGEFDMAREVLGMLAERAGRVFVAPSNHHGHMVKWLNDVDWRDDPANAEFILRMQLALVQLATNQKYMNEAEIERRLFLQGLGYHDNIPTGVRVLRMDDSLRFGGLNDPGVEVGMHGHAGPNGRRGSSAAFTHIGVKCSIGHTHTAGIRDGVYSAGVLCNLDMEYNKGPSSWSHSQIVHYPNGKRAIITQRGRKWRA